MMTTLGLTLGLLAAAPAMGGVVLESQVEDPAAAASAETVAQYLEAQIQGTWPESPGDFQVRLTWPDAATVRIRVAQADRTWVDRPIAVEDPDAARALVWLLVRSTIERVGLRAPAPVDETPPIPVAGAATEVETASVAEAPPPPPPAPAEASPEAEPPTPATPPRSPRRGLRRLTEAPFQLRADDQLLGAIAFRGFADPTSGFGWGPVFSTRLVLGGTWVVGAEFGFRSEQRTDNLTVNHIPFSALVGYRLATEWPVELGASLTFDPREVRNQNAAGTVDVTSLSLGIQTGLYARTHYTLWRNTKAELRLVGTVGTRFGLLRSGYTLDGNREEDAVVAFDTSVGVEWRWR